MVHKYTFKYILAAALVTTGFLVYHLYYYDDLKFIEPVNNDPTQHKSSSPDTKWLFPSNYDNPKLFLHNHPEINPSQVTHIHAPQPQPKAFGSSAVKQHKFTVFGSGEHINMKLEDCDKLKQELEVSVEKTINVGADLHQILTSVKNDIEQNPEGYMAEISPFFIDDLKLQLENQVVEAFWFRLAGSSVWLADFGVHYTVSRVVYSDRAVRNQPIFSLVYAQIFDKDWNELHNHTLMVPTNSDAKKHVNSDTEVHFTPVTFPQFIPIPFWHDPDNARNKYYGPEDAHVSLVKNKLGYEEPLVMFNAYNRKIVANPKWEPGSEEEEYKTVFVRSMFVGWPFQFQTGKLNTDGKSDPTYDNRLYTKVLELKLKGQALQKKQKNWVPMISQHERKERGYDSYIYAIYRWHDFEVLKCDIEDGTGTCVTDYRMSGNLDTTDAVGPLRGGTQMINIGDLIQSQTDVDLKDLIPPHREIWVGFPRAHLDNCGCGARMYRPNLAVVTKDSVVASNGVTEHLYKLTHVSSSVDFDVPIIGWELNNPKELCKEGNVLIPNGISTWNIESLKSKDGVWESQDSLTLMVSISDITVDRVNIQGLLNQILKIKGPGLFLSSKFNEKETIKKLAIPGLKELESSEKSASIGFNNDNVACAMKASGDFCKSYSETFSETFINPKEYEDFVKDHIVSIDLDKLKSYTDAIERKKQE